jgi:murein DD-endopeptidase MepM/ murein hydrolase activator NlpD
LGIGVAGHHLSHEGSVPVSIAAAPPPGQAADTTAVASTVASVLNSAPVQAIATAGKDAAAVIKPALAPKPETMIREAELEDGATFTQLLTSSGITTSDALAATSALAGVFDPRHLKSGQSVALSITRTGNQQRLDSATLQADVTKEITVARGADGTFAARIKTMPITREHFAARTEIHSSVYEAGERAHVPHALMASFMRIYSHAIDFQRDIHPGDSFEILYDQPTAANGAPAGEGDIIYAALIVGGKTRPVYRVTFNDGTVDYFDEKGQSIRRALLRTPVAAAHITSGFGMRMHPILGYSKMHQGVDFGAPEGAPIFAAGNGVVTKIEHSGSYGRYIEIRHNNKLETLYAHMSRFADGLYNGAKVSQGEVIGYVGMSGRATGPHLHFEVHVGDKPVNPLSVNLPTGRVLEGQLLTAFKKGQAKIKQEFAQLMTTNGTFFTQASATVPAFATKPNTSCGLRGGC